MPSPLLVRGTLHGITHERRTPFRQPAYDIYGFHVGRLMCRMDVSAEFGANMPFLAEGDEVELAASPRPIPDTEGMHLVFALHNREDDRTYVCHDRFRSSHAKMAPTAFSPGARRRLLKQVALLMGLAWLVILGIECALYFSGEPTDDSPSIALIALPALLFVWLIVAIPLFVSEWRWRRGRPNRRQRLLEEVYAAMRLGSPFAPSRRIHEV